MNYHYWNRYLKLLEYCDARELPNDTYTENHHCIPRSLGGTDSSDNLITMTAREHFIGHWLLAKATGAKQAYAAVLAMSMRNNCDRRFTSWQFALSRKYAKLAAKGSGNGRFDSNIYTFLHKSGHKFTGTRYDWRLLYSISKSNSNSLFGKSAYVSNGGWMIYDGGGFKLRDTRKPVNKICIKTGNILKRYASAKDTKKDGFNPTSVTGVCNPKRVVNKSHKGFYWQYA